MIAMSDNSASDTLLHLLGRDRVEQRLLSVGHSNPKRILPLLTTVEAFVLKSREALREDYIRRLDNAQRHFLRSRANQLNYKDVDAFVFASPNPKHIGSIEWFAAPNDLIGLLDYIRRSDTDGRMLQIMTANVGIAESRRPAWRYLGYKGGSEPGVLSMSYLALSQQGKYYAITASWNNPRAAVDEDKFHNFMARLIDQAAVR